MMFSPATIHVLPFDPLHGNDNARVYAGKYASKPEKVCRFLDVRYVEHQSVIV